MNELLNVSNTNFIMAVVCVLGVIVAHLFKSKKLSKTNTILLLSPLAGVAHLLIGFYIMMLVHLL